MTEERPPAVAQQAASVETDYRKLDDPAFIAERARIRECLARTPTEAADHAKLTTLYEAMTEEFDRRARAAWTKATADTATAAGRTR